MKQILILLLTLTFLLPTIGEAKAVHQFDMTDIDGNPVQLSSFSGKALLIVNTASKCGYTPQYASLEKLYDKYKERGFEVLAFPSNDFGGQEPGSNGEIKEFCRLNYKVKFPLFSKITVKGSGKDPLYEYLTQESPFSGDITWNFNKFLVNPAGEVVARFPSNVDPLDAKLIEQLEAFLPA